MLQSMNRFNGFTIHAEDGKIGMIDDLYFDDTHWTIRYLVLDTGKWLPGRRVLISPASVMAIDWPNHAITVSLKCEQVRNSPDIMTDKPVSRQHEAQLIAYYGWPSYWGADPFGPMALPPPLPAAKSPLPKGDPHLRSAHEVKGYHIEAVDGPVGHVSDFVLDDATWQIAFLIVDAGTWLHERLVLIKPSWVEGVSWDDRHVALALTREAVRTSPLFTSVFPVPSAYAEQLVQHYRRPE